MPKASGVKRGLVLQEIPQISAASERGYRIIITDSDVGFAGETQRYVIQCYYCSIKRRWRVNILLIGEQCRVSREFKCDDGYCGHALERADKAALEMARDRLLALSEGMNMPAVDKTVPAKKKKLAPAMKRPKNKKQ